MRKHSLPQAREIDRAWCRRNDLEWDLRPQALEGWAPHLMAAADKTENTISVLEPIGQDYWTGEGITAKRVAGILRAFGAETDVTVHINSPGGDLFEGMAIYNLLRDHKGEVTVKVIGVAASAASIIAMAGDQVQIARAGFLMIHSCWVVAMGNRNDLRDIADTLEPFDTAMADIYAARSGLEAKAVQKMMDKETWIAGAAAVDQGFADDLLPADQVAHDPDPKPERTAAYLLDMALAKAGMPRSERRSLLQDYKGTPRATDDGTRDAAEFVSRLFSGIKLDL